MAQLGALVSFTAGTPAVADDVNYNFNLIRTFLNSSSVGVDNLEGTLSSRSGAPILTLEQTSEPFSPLYIINAQNKNALHIWQQASLDAGQALVYLNDTITQTDTTTAGILMAFAAGSLNPALLIKHGATENLRFTSSELDLFNSAVEISNARVKLPVRTTGQRNAITQEGSIVYNTDTDQVNVRRSDAWTPIDVPVGSIQMYAVDATPEGWLLCNGKEYLKTAYPKLDAVLSSSGTYPYGETNGSGGAGTTHFRVPNLVGIFPRGSIMDSITSQVIGGETFTAQSRSTSQRDATAVNGLSATQAAHNHTYERAVGGGQADNASGGNPYAGNVADNTGNAQPVITLTGDTETRPANISLAFIIKY
jgi:microcystin-dependent protein